LSVEGKVIFLSGGTGLLGWTYCNALSEMGARIILSDLEKCRPADKAKELHDGYGNEVLGIACDIGREKDVVEAFAHATERFGRIDVVINNAAATGEFLMGQGEVFADFEDYPLSVWEEVLRINLTGAFLVAREGGKVMKAGGGGSLINISSIYGFVGPDHRIYENMPFRSFPGYSASKAGVHGLTVWLATYWGRSGIRVNTVVPGGVYNGHSKEFVERYSNRTPIGRMAEKEDLVGMIVFLASDASCYCTGQKFVVDGGLTAW
jgi:NAD(P)-dependent dehydrogenase (short-subunit alcohol dehydrogenase family)